ncbi:hypothetical protein ACFFLM_06225 [Deinococcus oregonensis]|uniref:Uncharacterized protein n=1 Tax=Deinococcus oregonensis TaxID=1805970 RepID=A0ABV6AVN1_9DEIO
MTETQQLVAMWPDTVHLELQDKGSYLNIQVFHGDSMTQHIQVSWEECGLDAGTIANYISL